MLQTIEAIVLRVVKYSDTSVIVDCFTRAYGRMSFVASVSRSRRSSAGNIWQPLAVVEFQADIRPGGKLPKAQGVHLSLAYRSLFFEPVKLSLAMFIAEFLSSALREEKENAPLYIYIMGTLQMLDEIEHPVAVANIHIAFMLHLTRFLGIMPNVESDCSPTAVFDLLAGTYTAGLPSHRHFLMPAEAQQLPVLLRMDYANMRFFRFTRQQRQRILDVLLSYYRLHVPMFPELKSVEILNELF